MKLLNNPFIFPRFEFGERQKHIEHVCHLSDKITAISALWWETELCLHMLVIKDVLIWYLDKISKYKVGGVWLQLHPLWSKWADTPEKLPQRRCFHCLGLALFVFGSPLLWKLLLDLISLQLFPVCSNPHSISVCEEQVKDAHLDWEDVKDKAAWTQLTAT